MRGTPESQHQLYYAIDVEAWLEPDHALRGVKQRADAVLACLRPEFEAAYGRMGRPSIPPEMLLKALLLQALYSIRSERLLVAEIRWNLLYRWFLDLPFDAPVWNHSTFSKNRERFETNGLVRRFFEAVIADAHVEDLASEEHFSVDGTLIASYASMKSVHPLDAPPATVGEGADDDDPGNPTVSFHGQRRSNATHRSITDPEARLARKGPGKEAQLAHAAHVLMENRHGLVIDATVTEANGYAERDEALAMLRRARGRQPIEPSTLAADKGYDAGAFLLALETDEGVVPLVPIRSGPITSVTPEADARRRTRRRAPTKRYRTAQRVRKRVEEIFGWAKTIGGMHRARHVGRWKIEQQWLMVLAAYNLLRLTRLQTASMAG